MATARVFSLVLAAGSGKRFRDSSPSGQSLPPSKALATLAGKPVLSYSIRTFDNFLPLTLGVVVCPTQLQTFIGQFAPSDWRFVTGGAERQDSVLRGLSFLADNQKLGDRDTVYVHDGVRPFFNLDELERLRQAAQKSGCATLSRQVTDTTVDISQNKYLDRAKLRSIQTPQCLRGDVALGIIKLLNGNTEGKNFTDETSMATALGFSVSFIDGNRYNRKLTYFEDLPEFETIASRFYSI